MTRRDEVGVRRDFDRRVVVVPVGGGGTLSGIWKGFLELPAWGQIRKLPHMAGVLPSGYTMLAEALERGVQSDSELR